ncbi:MAG TPA: hypothetical protein VM261_19015 [Kofleriaceae bacterium]|nr:hypothetical protein [Kofleriaceae bacterium]
MRVNYFGHAAVASWQTAGDALAGVTLGAMLPDFSVMCGARIAAGGSADVDAGIALHHATDAVFHTAPAVSALFRDAEKRMEARGVRRGPMRAAAHVGVELVLDGVLLDDARHRDAYTAAMAHDTAALVWKEDGDAERFAMLLARLRHHGVPEDLRRPRAAAERIFRMLAGRRLLAPEASERGAIADVLEEIAPRIAVAAPTIIRQVEAGLAQRASTDPGH